MTHQSERRTKNAQRIQRRTDAWDLRCKGWAQARIAAELGVNQSTICRDLEVASKHALANLDTIVEEVKREQVFQLERIVDESLQGWEESKKKSRSVSKTVRTRLSGIDTQEETTTTKVADRGGDVRYLTTAMNALADIRKILGADAPIEVDIDIEDIDGAIARELERLASQQEDSASQSTERTE